MLLRLFILSFACLSLCSAIGLAPGLYCGLENCYEVLGINRDEFDKATLPKIYRKLARVYHPDRIKKDEDREQNEEKFRLIATAYETLKDDETRGYYDYYLDHPEERYYNYYQYYRMRAAPKVDVRLVILATILVISTIQYLSARQKYSEALSYAKEQIKFRNMAIDIAQQRGLLELERGKIKKKQKNGVNPEEVLNKIIEENIQISGGYKKGSIYDTLAWQIIIFPLTLFHWSVWKAKWVNKYWIKREDYDEEAKLYLIRKNMKLSEAQFQGLESREIDEYLEKELWKKAEFDKWKEEKELGEKEKLANSGRYKQYRRFMKKQAGSTISFLED
uniref:J domain-containing protein n=1 Tax=Acrobeloides nanus TaxID=290746 RepID=A0A914C7H7_9BILA